MSATLSNYNPMNISKINLNQTKNNCHFFVYDN